MSYQNITARLSMRAMELPRALFPRPVGENEVLTASILGSSAHSRIIGVMRDTQFAKERHDPAAATDSPGNDPRDDFSS